MKALKFFAILGCKYMVDFAMIPLRGLESTEEVFDYVTAVFSQPDARLKCDVLQLVA